MITGFRSRYMGYCSTTEWLLDNALLELLAVACTEESRYEFMFMALPLKVVRGTGSPANPIAMF